MKSIHGQLRSWATDTGIGRDHRGIQVGYFNVPSRRLRCHQRCSIRVRSLDRALARLHRQARPTVAASGFRGEPGGAVATSPRVCTLHTRHRPTLRRAARRPVDRSGRRSGSRSLSSPADRARLSGNRRPFSRSHTSRCDRPVLDRSPLGPVIERPAPRCRA
jgi:hypothetical protein